MGDIDRIQPVISSLQSLSSLQRVGDGASRQHAQQEEKPPKEDQVELTNEVELDQEPAIAPVAEDHPEGGLDLAV